MAMFDQYKPALHRLGQECDGRYRALMERLGDLIDAVRDSSADPTDLDIFYRASAVQLNGTQILGKVPVGELWVLDFISASANTWTLRTQAYGVVFGAQPVVLAESPVFMPGDEISIVTTGATDVYAQFTRRPIVDKLPARARTGSGKDNVSGQGGNPQHEPRAPIGVTASNGNLN